MRDLALTATEDEGSATMNSPLQANSFDQLRRPRSLKLSEQIARQMVDYIIDNGLEEGTRLPVEQELGKMLGVGRNTLREAFRLLEAWGVTEIRQGRNGGAVVSHPAPSDLRGPLTVQLLFAGSTLKDVLEIRQLLEPETAYLAAERMTDEQLVGLEDSIQRMRALSSGSQDAFIQENKVFHELIAEAAGNIVLRSVIESIEAVFDGSAQGVDYNDRRRNAVCDAHARITEAIRRRDPHGARREMRDHIQEAGDYWSKDEKLMAKRLRWPH